MPDIDIDAPGKNLLLMGNEAIARGALLHPRFYRQLLPLLKRETFTLSGRLMRPLLWNRLPEQL